MADEAKPNMDGAPKKVKKTKKSKDASSSSSKRKKKDKTATGAAKASSAPLTICARARARALCRVMELRVSISRYYLQEAQYMDRVRSRVALSIAAFHDTGDAKYGRKVLSALDSLSTPRDTPEELRHDLDLLHALEAELQSNATPRADIADDDLSELAVCLRDEIEVLRASIVDARANVATLNARGAMPPTPS